MGTRTRPCRFRSAFTLVELLVVIAIISVLAALLMPALEGALDAAHAAACTSNLKQTGVAYTLYADDHEGQICAAKMENGDAEFTYTYHGNADTSDFLKETTTKVTWAGILQGLAYIEPALEDATVKPVYNKTYGWRDCSVMSGVFDCPGQDRSLMFRYWYGWYDSYEYMASWYFWRTGIHPLIQRGENDSHAAYFRQLDKAPRSLGDTVVVLDSPWGGAVLSGNIYQIDSANHANLADYIRDRPHEAGYGMLMADSHVILQNPIEWTDTHKATNVSMGWKTDPADADLWRPPSYPW